MKRIAVLSLVIIFALSAALLIACKGKVEDPQKIKDDYIAAVETKIADLETKITDLKAKAETLEGQAKDDLNLQITDLEAKRDAAKTKLEEIKTLGLDAWEGAKGDLDTMMGDIDSVITTLFQ